MRKNNKLDKSVCVVYLSNLNIYIQIFFVLVFYHNANFTLNIKYIVSYNNVISIIETDYLLFFILDVSFIPRDCHGSKSEHLLCL